MKLFFHQPLFNSQLMRVVSHTFNGCADIGECMVTASRIKEGDFESWHEEWFKTADRLMQEGKDAESKGHSVSAREAYLRASNYYRVSLFFLYTSPVDSRALDAIEKHQLSFARAARLFSPQFEAVQIPYEEGHLPGYFYKVDHSGTPRPTLICNGGYDSTHQEAYFFTVPSALKRGYNVLAFEGPGQGSVLFQQRIPMRHDWEKVITPVVNFLDHRIDVDKAKIALYGASWGGMLTPRGAAFDRRISALIVNPGQYDAMENIKKIMENATDGSDMTVNTASFLQAAMQDKFLASKFYAKMFVHGLESPMSLIEEWKKYHNRDIAPMITCPTLVADAENEHLSAGQAKELFEALSCPKEYILFTSAEGAGEHCCMGAQGLFNQRIFDWLDETFTNCAPVDTEEPLTVINLGYSGH